MAEQINELGATLGLLQQGFTPAQAQARVDEARAMQFAQLNPSQQRTMLGMQAATGLGRSLSGLFGVQQEDPLMKMATQLRATLREQDMETSEGVLKAYRAVKDINPGIAEGLLKRYSELRKQEAELESTKALTAQRSREKQAADPKEQFARTNADKFTPESLQAFMESGKFSDLKPITKETAATKPPADFLAVAVELGHGEKVKFGDYTAEQVKQINQTLLDRETGKRKAGAPTTSVNVKVADKTAESMGTKAGGVVGEGVGLIQGKEDAITALQEAQNVLKSGIYSGKYGPIQEALAGYAGIGSKERLANTEFYRSLIGDVVIPRLQDFGGNDSVEELKYLRSVLAGETTLEPAALKRVLASAERKIKRGIERVQAQQTAVQQGKPLPTNVRGARKTVDWGDLNK